jgi:DNA-binding HxlR family transcriptional regulator
MIDFNKIDKTIHERGRLAIMTLLATRAEWPFQDLKASLKMSDGNLITHLRALEGAGYLTATKCHTPRPQTTYSLTPKGRKAFEKYLAILEEILGLGKG